MGISSGLLSKKGGTGGQSPQFKYNAGGDEVRVSRLG